MMGKKCDSGKKFRGVKIIIGVLAMIGAASIVKGTKKWVKEKCCKVTSVIKSDTQES